MKHAYIFTRNDRPSSLTARRVMGAFVFVNAPIASPLRFNAVPAGCMTVAFIVSKVPADKVLVRFR